MNTKEKIARILQNQNDFCSGEFLAEKCKVSRAAVWKAVHALRKDGWKIDAATNKGYRLAEKADEISADEIKIEIEKSGVQSGEIFAFKTIDSTSSEAKRRIANVGSFRDSKGNLTESGRTLHRAIFVSDTQTGGRGRTGRSFASPAKSGAYFSLVYAPKNGVQNPAVLTAAAAVAVSRSLDSLFGMESKIKWVNDIFLEIGGSFKKVCGILAEGAANFETGKVECAIVGIGVNVKNAHFGAELAEIAGSVEEAAGRIDKSRNEIIARICAELLKIYDSEENIIEEYRSRSLILNRRIFVNPLALGESAGGFFADAKEITDGAELVVQTDDGKTLVLHSGEVSLHGTIFRAE